MLTIVMRHAPKSRAQKTKTFLETLTWAHSSPFSSPQEERTNRRTKEKLPYVCGVALNATPLHLEYGFIPGTKKSNGTPLYVSLNYVEKWAISRGFHKLQDVLRERGYLFWKEGQYFSKAQILVHINRVRLNHKLPLLHLQGQENRAQHLE